MKKKETMDGNRAAALAAYAFTEVASIYPITPSTPIAESVEEWSANGMKNIFGATVNVVEMQSEAGAAAAMRGALQSGVLASTFTASQGLLLMIPSLYKMVGELLPGVLHITARSIATHALSIFGDHQDVMACRQTGVAMLASSNVQEVMDFATIAHLSSIKSSIPFIHFFDGFRTSHEYQKIETIAIEDAKALLDMQAVNNFRKRALNPDRPVVRGTTQNPDIYFQQRECANPFYNSVPQIVQDYFARLRDITSRNYNLFDYYGSDNADRIIVAMGSVCDTIEETVDYLNANGQNVGVVKVRLYRPFAEQSFINSFPKTVKSIAVLDRTKEPGAPGEPLYLDVTKALKGKSDIKIVGGRYGLSSKDTRPSQIVSVFKNLAKLQPKDRFTIGIIDDVTHTSLPEEQTITTTPEGTISCKIWGLGSDGTVGSNKSAIKIIGDHTDLYVQGYFSYDSKKSGGTTVSHLRFGQKPIKSPYLVYSADYIACHNSSFVNQYNLLKGIKKGGTFVLNCPWSSDELEQKLPADMKREIVQNNISFYVIDAMKIASQIGLGNRINMIMQTVFFRLTKVIPFDDAVTFLKESINKMYGKKGKNIVDMNLRSIDQAKDALIKIDVPKSWQNANDTPLPEKQLPDFVKNIQIPMAKHEGDELPVSAFAGMEDGTFPSGTTAYEKRGIAPFIPEWQIDKCIQCGQCSFICPHSTIRQFLLDEDEYSRKPDTFKTKKAIGKGLSHLHYRVQVSPLDCTGCGNCADICPAKGKALIMKPADIENEMESENWEFGMTITAKNDVINKNTVKGSQFLTPYLEFNGACPGCGEPAYIKLITQLFGDRMIISNATGCSSIWGASAPSIAYSTDRHGKGPAWINPLFEDAAEFGLGIELGIRQMRKSLMSSAKMLLQSSTDENMKISLSGWLEAVRSGSETIEASNNLVSTLEKSAEHDDNMKFILDNRDYLNKKSVWAIGGDGWSYDIGYGGLDHVLSTGADINIFVMDTEVYSNTGGQCSKSTPTAAVAKLAAAGKRRRKKDLGLMAMSYGTVYVAQIAMGADMNQTLKAIIEAEQHPGPSLIIAYSPCVSHGIKSGMGTSVKQQKRAVESGYWHLYRYNPLLKREGKNPFILDSRQPKTEYKEFISSEIRFSQLENVYPDIAPDLYMLSQSNAAERYERYNKLSEQNIF